MEKNTVGTVAMGAGIGVVVFQLLLVCTGWIPIVNLLSILFLPLLLICDVTAIVTGIMGMKKAKLLDGLGKNQAMVGLVIGILHTLFMLLLVVIGVIAGGFALIMGALGG